MKDLFLACSQILEDGQDVVMVSIINQGGSAPRTAGSKMLVLRDGGIIGTIGGGSFEAQAMRMAQDVFQSRQSMTRAFTFSLGDVTGMDMICGGKAEIFIDLLRASHPENAAVCRAVSDVKRRDQDACLVTKLVTGPGSEGQAKLALVAGDKDLVGMHLGRAELDALHEERKGRRLQRLVLEEATYLIEPLHNPGTVYIFGAGHVSQKLAHLAAFVDFRTVILDDREEYANAARFPQADQVLVPESMERCVRDLPISRNSYLVIVTRGHAFDLSVLSQALQTDAGYIGMIGSRKKRETVYRHLLQDGISEVCLARVHSPIGIEIASETPQEIAVSIVAELIQARARLTDV